VYDHIQANNVGKLTSLAGSTKAEHQHHLRNSVVRSSRSMNAVRVATETLHVFSSRWSASSDGKLIASEPDSNKPSLDQATPRRRKRGWPKGVPKKKQQVSQILSCSLLVIKFCCWFTTHAIHCVKIMICAIIDCIILIFV